MFICLLFRIIPLFQSYKVHNYSKRNYFILSFNVLFFVTIYQQFNY